MVGFAEGTRYGTGTSRGLLVAWFLLAKFDPYEVGVAVAEERVDTLLHDVRAE